MRTMRTISPYDDVVDSTDVLARLECLEAQEEQGGLDDSEQEELDVLKDLRDQCKDCTDWEEGTTLIRESHFQTYAQELAEECGLIPDTTACAWPLTCIDWGQAARDLQVDYTPVKWGGTWYFVRS